MKIHWAVVKNYRYEFSQLHPISIRSEVINALFWIHRTLLRCPVSSKLSVRRKSAAFRRFSSTPQKARSNWLSNRKRTRWVHKHGKLVTHWRDLTLTYKLVLAFNRFTLKVMRQPIRQRVVVILVKFDAMIFNESHFTSNDLANIFLLANSSVSFSVCSVIFC